MKFGEQQRKKGEKGEMRCAPQLGREDGADVRLDIAPPHWPLGGAVHPGQLSGWVAFGTG